MRASNLAHHADFETEVAQRSAQIIVDSNGLRLQQFAMSQQHL
jgi:hypothetical protein